MSKRVHRFTHKGVTHTRTTSTGRVFTHAVVLEFTSHKTMVSWHMTEAAALKVKVPSVLFSYATCGMLPVHGTKLVVVL